MFLSASIQALSYFSLYHYHRPKTYPLPELVQYIYQMMYRTCNIYSPPKWLFRFAAFVLEQNPFIPYMTRDVLTRVSST